MERERTEIYANSLRNNKEKIIEFIGSTTLLYGLLEPDDCDQIRNVRHQKGKRECISDIIGMLLKYDNPDKFKRLYQIAEDNGLRLLQLTLDDKFTEEMWTKWKKDRKALHKCSSYIANNMNQSDMLKAVDFLLSNGALIPDDSDRIRKHSSEGVSEQIWELIEFLPSRSPNWFQFFLDWLNIDKNLSYLVRVLEKEREKVVEDLQEISHKDFVRNKPTLAPTLWKKGSMVAHGLFGDVYKCLDLKTGREFVVKTAFLEDRAKDQISEKAFRIEIRLYSEITNHPRLVQYFGFEENSAKHELNIFFEYMIGGSLQNLLHEYGPLPEEIVRRYTAQIVEGLAYLHQQKIIHRNIKVKNIYRGPDGNVKIGDFGITKRLSGNDTDTECNSFVGESPRYMAPEMILGNNYSFKVDIWALGWTVVEMFTGKPPYDGATSDFQLLFKIASATKPEYSLPKKVTQTASEFVDLTLKTEADERPMADDLLCHDFLQKLSDN